MSGINNKEKMKELNTYRLASPWLINGTSYGIQNGQAERKHALCMVFLRKSELRTPTEQSSCSGTSIRPLMWQLNHPFRLIAGKGLSNWA